MPNVPQFSIVMPVRDEFRLLRWSLPSCYNLGPDEVLLCLDAPVHEQTIQEAKRISSDLGWSSRTKILTIERNPKYLFHQAWARRQGFLAAKHDRLLTVDADLIVNGNVHKAVSLVGRGDIGLVSCATLHSVEGCFGLWRAASLHLAGRLRSPAFTGLYALWRPYWIDTEDDGIKLLRDPKTPSVKGSLVLVGEDAYLRNCMQLKHGCVYLADIGAYAMRADCNDNPHIQFELGRYYAEKDCSLVAVLARSLALARPYVLRGYLHQKTTKELIPTHDPDTYHVGNQINSKD